MGRGGAVRAPAAARTAAPARSAVSLSIRERWSWQVGSTGVGALTLAFLILLVCNSGFRPEISVCSQQDGGVPEHLHLWLCVPGVLRDVVWPGLDHRGGLQAILLCPLPRLGHHVPAPYCPARNCCWRRVGYHLRRHRRAGYDPVPKDDTVQRKAETDSLPDSVAGFVTGKKMPSRATKFKGERPSLFKQA